MIPHGRVLDKVPILCNWNKNGDMAVCGTGAAATCPANADSTRLARLVAAWHRRNVYLTIGHQSHHLPSHLNGFYGNVCKYEADNQ